MTRYVIHPGIVRSATDRDWHYIGVGALLRLWKVPQGAPYVVMETDKWGMRERMPVGYQEHPDDVHCYPRYRYDEYPFFRPDVQGVRP